MLDVNDKLCNHTMIDVNMSYTMIDVNGVNHTMLDVMYNVRCE